MQTIILSLDYSAHHMLLLPFRILLYRLCWIDVFSNLSCFLCNKDLVSYSEASVIQGCHIHVISFMIYHALASIIPIMFAIRFIVFTYPIFSTLLVNLTIYVNIMQQFKLKISKQTYFQYIYITIKETHTYIYFICLKQTHSSFSQNCFSENILFDYYCDVLVIQVRNVEFATHFSITILSLLKIILKILTPPNILFLTVTYQSPSLGFIIYVYFEL